MLVWREWEFATLTVVTEVAPLIEHKLFGKRHGLMAPHFSVTRVESESGRHSLFPSKLKYVVKSC